MFLEKFLWLKIGKHGGLEKGKAWRIREDKGGVENEKLKTLLNSFFCKITLWLCFHNKTHLFLKELVSRLVLVQEENSQFSDMVDKF